MENNELRSETPIEEEKIIKIKGLDYKIVISKSEKGNNIIIELSEVKSNNNISFKYEASLDKITKDIKFLYKHKNVVEIINSLNDLFNRGKITVEEKGNKYIMIIEDLLLGKLSKYEIELSRQERINEKIQLLKIKDINNKLEELKEEINYIKNNINEKLIKEIKEELNIKEIIKEVIKDKEIKDILFKEFEERLSNIFIKKTEKNGDDEIINKKINESVIKIIDNKYSSKVDEKVFNNNINKIREDMDNYKNEINRIKNNIEKNDFQIKESLNRSMNINNINDDKKYHVFRIKSEEEEYDGRLNKTVIKINKNDGEDNAPSMCTIHRNVLCDKCGMKPIIGYRYNCLICPNYDLCENCMQKNNETREHKHKFKRMGYKENKPEEIMDYKFDIKDYIPGNFFKRVFLEEEKEIKFEFTIVNICDHRFPGNGRTKFVTINNEIPDIIIDEIEPLSSKHIIINIPKQSVKLGEKKFKLFLNVDGKNYNYPIVLTLIGISKKVQNFRKEFNLSEKEYDEQKLLNILQKYKYDFASAFSSLYN